MDQFLERVSDILETDATNETVLRECEAWDSLTALSLVAMFDRHYGITLTADQLVQSVTVGDLRTIVEGPR